MGESELLNDARPYDDLAWAADSDSGDSREEEVADDGGAAAEEEDSARERVWLRLGTLMPTVCAAASLGRESRGDGADGACSGRGSGCNGSPYAPREGAPLLGV